MARRRKKGSKMAGKRLARKATCLLTLVVAMAVLTASAAASASLGLNGSFSTTVLKPDNVSLSCTIGAFQGQQCGVIQLAGLGAADFVYEFGPTFDPIDKNHFTIDGTFTIILRSDGSTISGASHRRLLRPEPSRRTGQSSLVRQSELRERHRRVRRWHRPVRGTSRNRELPTVLRWSEVSRDTCRDTRRQLT